MRTVLILLATLLLAASSAVVPAYAAAIRFTEEALRNVPENQEISLKAVAAYELLPYEFKRDVAEKRAAQVFKENPVTRSVQGKGFTSEETDEDLIFFYGSIEFWVAKPTGAEILLDLDRYAVAEMQRLSLEEKRLEEIARDYIREQIPDVNLGELRCTKIRRLINASGRLDPEDEKATDVRVEVANFIVIYQRQIDGIPVVGPGEQVRIYLSVNGDVIGHSKVWRQLGEKIFTRPVLSTEEIKEIFINQHAKDPVEQIEVDQLCFGYLAEGRYTKQNSLRPYYILGYTYGPHSKRVLERYDAYTGELARPPADEEAGTIKEGVEECPPGCTCLSKREGYQKGLDFCRDEQGNLIRCGVICAECGEYKYCFRTDVPCHYDPERNACVGSCPEGQVCQAVAAGIEVSLETGETLNQSLVCRCAPLPRTARLTIGQQRYTVDGKVYEADVAPFIRGDRTYTPVRYLAYTLGLSEHEIAWDPAARKVTLSRGAVKVELFIGRPVIIINRESNRLMSHLSLKRIAPSYRHGSWPTPLAQASSGIQVSAR